MEYNFKHFENSLGSIYCSIRYHERLRAITVTWKGTATEEGIRTVKIEIAKMIQRHPGVVILNDIQGFFTASTETLTALIRSNWNEDGLAAGASYILHILKPGMEAPVLPQDLTGSIKFFHSKLDALEWMEKKRQE